MKSHIVGMLLLGLGATAQAQFTENEIVVTKCEYGLTVCTADWNRDGKNDVIAGGYAGEQPRLHLQNTKGSYTVAVEFPFDAEAHFLATADFNNDGNPDLIAGGGHLELFFGNGKSGFSRKKTVGTEYAEVTVVADFDRDGNMDIITSSAPQMMWYKGNGKGDFSQHKIADIKHAYSIAAADFNGDSYPDLVFNDGETIFYLQNKEGKSFDKTQITAATTYFVAVADMDGNGLLDISFVEKDTAMNTWLNKGNGAFELGWSEVLQQTPQKHFAADVNKDGQADVVLVGYSGEISFLIRNANNTFMHFLNAGKIENYLRDAHLLAADPQSITLLHVGLENCGVYELFLPIKSSWEKQFAGNPFSVMSENTAKAIQNTLSKDYNLKDNIDFIYTFEFKDSYVVWIEKDWHFFDKKGEMLQTAATDKKPAMYQPTEKGSYNAFDLAADIKENTKKRNAGEGYNYACFMLNEYAQTYLKDIDLQWHSVSRGMYFDYMGSRQTADKKRHNVYVCWQSYSEGLEWNFWTYDIVRAPENTDAFSIISDDAVSKRVRTYMEKRYIGERVAQADVFVMVYRNFTTPQNTENVGFDANNKGTTEIGVYIGGKTYFFTKDGAFSTIDN